jgi:hypothetical protein
VTIIEANIPLDCQKKFANSLYTLNFLPTRYPRIFIIKRLELNSTVHRDYKPLHARVMNPLKHQGIRLILDSL